MFLIVLLIRQFILKLLLWRLIILSSGKPLWAHGWLMSPLNLKCMCSIVSVCNVYRSQFYSECRIEFGFVLLPFLYFLYQNTALWNIQLRLDNGLPTGICIIYSTITHSDNPLMHWWWSDFHVHIPSIYNWRNCKRQYLPIYIWMHMFPYILEFNNHSSSWCTNVLLATNSRA